MAELKKKNGGQIISTVFIYCILCTFFIKCMQGYTYFRRMKRHFAALFLIILLTIFSTFIIQHGKSKEVLSVVTPTKLAIDFNNDKIISNEEFICVDGVESFSLEPNDAFISKYSSKFNLTYKDIISLGFLAQEYAQKTLLSKKVSVKFTQKVTPDCRYANIKINSKDYSELLSNSGFGIKSERIPAQYKFNKNLEQSKTLNLVILNHHSNKFHELNCEYGKQAHDQVIIPFNQLPKDAIPCRFCHKEKEKKHKKISQNIYNIPNILSPELIHSEGNITLFYTDYTRQLKPNNKCQTSECKAFINLVNNAKEKIDIAIYGYDEVPAITQSLINAKSRGVKIRFVYDEAHNSANTFYKNNEIIKKLADENKSDKNTVAAKSNILMHNKFIIFDNSIVFTGSMNFSKTGLSGYDENNVLIINSKEIANLYTEEFEQMLSGKFHKDKNKHSLSNRFQLGKSELEIYFSPQDKSSHRIIQIINNARKYIYVPTFLITHEKISEALINAHKRGIDVKIIIDANSTSTTNTKHSKLRDSGIPLKTENYAGKMHSKTMIIDDEYIIMGSMNFSNSGENKNDENMVVITNQNLAKNYAEFFMYLWKMIPDKYLKFNAKPESRDSIGSCTDGVDNNFNSKIDAEDEGCIKTSL